MPNPGIALIIDRSGSMGTQDSIGYAKASAAAFINTLNAGDRCCVVSFAGEAVLVQPLTSITSQQSRDAIANAIAGITAHGISNMAAPIQLASRQIGNVTGPRALILLSDGMWNDGPDPLTILPSFPVHTIALGNNGQQQVLQDIAERTGGQYHFAAGHQELTEAFFAVVQGTGIARTVTNQSGQIAPHHYQEVSIPLSDELPMATFTVSWDNLHVVYSKRAPRDGEVNITVYDPRGLPYKGKPAYVQPGAAVFHIPEPAPGLWSVGCWYAGREGAAPLGCVWGGFIPPRGPNLLVRPGDASVKGEATFDLSLEEEDGEPLDNVVYRAYGDSPLLARKEVMRQYVEGLQKVVPDPVLMEQGPDAGRTGPVIEEADARLLTLEHKLGTSLQPRQQYPLHAVKSGTGWQLRLPANVKPGSHVVHVTARGYSRVTRRMEQRTGTASIHIIHPFT